MQDWTGHKDPDDASAASSVGATSTGAAPTGIASLDTGPNNTRESVAALAFDVYASQVSATARSLRESASDELHRRHNNAEELRRADERHSRTRS